MLTLTLLRRVVSDVAVGDSEEIHSDHLNGYQFCPQTVGFLFYVAVGDSEEIHSDHLNGYQLCPKSQCYQESKRWGFGKGVVLFVCLLALRGLKDRSPFFALRLTVQSAHQSTSAAIRHICAKLGKPSSFID